jgi:hypothetical protein
MHTYHYTETNSGVEVWVVAFVHGQSQHLVAAFNTEIDAAAYTSYLNGGPVPKKLVSDHPLSEVPNL